MKSRVRGNGTMKELRSAWTVTRHSWQRTEKSLEALVVANRDLLRRLGDAGAVMVNRTGKEFAATVAKLERAGRSARRQFDRLTRHHETLQRHHTA